MRVTAEEFNWRKENRVTGAYVTQPPRARRRGRQPTKPTCENCGLETEYLFDGFKFPRKPETVRRMKPADLAKAKALSRAFQTEPAKVCMRCRPPSNLEIEEILNVRSKTSERSERVLVRRLRA